MHEHLSLISRKKVPKKLIIHTMLKLVYGDIAMTLKTVYKCYERFKMEMSRAKISNCRSTSFKLKTRR